MTSGVKTPDSVIAQIRELAAQGISQRQISAMLGVHRTQVNIYAKGYSKHENQQMVEKTPAGSGVMVARGGEKIVAPMGGSVKEPWWYKYGVKHDDGAKLIMGRLPDKVLCFGDIQAPLHHPDTLQFLCAVIARHKPDAFVMMGDEADLTGLKKHFMNADSLGPAQELKQVIEFMQALFKIVPEAIALTSNHVGDRLSYAQGQGNIPNLMMRRWADVVGAPNGWIWRDYIVWDKWLIEHGHKIAKGSRPNLLEGMAKRFNRHLSVMRGHHHSELGEHVKPVWMPGDWQARQCFTGCLMDYRKAGYTRDALMVGCVVLDKGVPHAIKMAVDESNRWTGILIEG